LPPNNVALKSIHVGSWFRLSESEKQKDFELALNLAKKKPPALFQVAHEFDLTIFKKQFGTSLVREKPESSLLKGPK